eukprot:TRINITY_DN27978_c0_g1_i1.p5 TRINITY_DN27978_c0_g1~~TRINITY_DN27978_c0_g1_i1.p5  ORF type:complete len:148 (+),score=20.20 TRINITY_DN27978_c0_g1_i1:119-562(+)
MCRNVNIEICVDNLSSAINAIHGGVNRYEALEKLIECGVDMVLTSGGKQTAWEGRQTIKQLQEQSNNRIRIQAGAGVDVSNVVQLIQETGVQDIHSSCSFEKDNCGLRSKQITEIRGLDMGWKYTSLEIVEGLCEVVDTYCASQSNI